MSNKELCEAEREPCVCVRNGKIAPPVSLLRYVPPTVEIVVCAKHQLVQHIGLGGVR
jgi:hypothetical protein